MSQWLIDVVVHQSWRVDEKNLFVGLSLRLKYFRLEYSFNGLNLQ